MFYRLRKRLSYGVFHARCRHVWRTPPIKTKGGEVEIVSLVSHRDVLLYIAAIKTFYARLGRGRITVLDDGSLTARDLARLSQHIDTLRVVPISQIPTGRCPRGGCWERILYIADASPRSYVIQLDADTVTTSAIPEVITHLEQNHSFVLGTSYNQAWMSFEAAAALAEGLQGSHIQLASERLLKHINVPSARRYARGCAGFSGFAQGSVTRQSIEAFSCEMEHHLGRRWHEWGTEQVTSNVMIAHSQQAHILPFPKYSGFEGTTSADVAFHHFYGTYRFTGSTYVALVRAAAERLRNRET